MGFFDSLKNAQTFEKGTPLKCPTLPNLGPDGKPQYLDGVFKLEIQKTHVIKTNAKGYAFIAEMTVQESNNPANPVGSSASWYQNLTDSNVAMPAMKEFLAAVLGYDLRDAGHKAAFQKDVEPQIESIADAASDGTKNPLKGKILFANTKMVTTKKGTDFTRHQWRPGTSPV